MEGSSVGLKKKQDITASFADLRKLGEGKVLEEEERYCWSAVIAGEEYNLILYI